MPINLNTGASPNAALELVRTPDLLVPSRLGSVRGLHAVPLALCDDPVIYALCTRRTIAPGRVEGETLYVGLTDDLHRRISEHRALWWREHREPFVLVLWWPHPPALHVEHGISAAVAESAFIRYLRPRYNNVRGDEFGPLLPLHRKALALHGVKG